MSQYRVTEGIVRSGAEGHQVAGVDMRRGMRHDGAGGDNRAGDGT